MKRRSSGGPVLDEKTVKHGKKKKPFWTTKTMAEDIGREELLAATFNEILMHVFSLVLLSIFIFSQISASQYYLTHALSTVFSEDDLNGISSASGFWQYLETTMLDTLYNGEITAQNNEAPNEKTTTEGQSTKNPTEQENTTEETDTVEELIVLYENKVLGVPRMRQVKVTNSSCEIHGYFRRIFLACYSRFTEQAEDRKPFGPGDSTAWRYHDSTKTESQSHYGILSKYSGGGYYVDFTRHKDTTAALLSELKDQLWITRGTRAVFIDFSVYNANLNLFCICKFVFEFLPSGGITPSTRFTPAILVSFNKPWDWALRIMLYLYGIYVLFSFCEEIREIIYFRMKYLAQFWNYIDISVILLTVSLIAGTEYMRFIVPSYIRHIKHHRNKYGNLEYVRFFYMIIESSGAVLLFFVYIRTFKFLNFNRRMSQLNDTIKKCAKDIAGFSVMFFVAYFAYAELGYLVFGSQVQGFKSFQEAMFTLLRTILGDFDYMEIHRANWLVAPIYFLSYIILVFFILLNMFLAIINDTYSDVKTDIAIAPKEMQMTEYLRRGFNRILRKLGCRVKSEAEKEVEFNATIVQIRDALVKCNFEDREIEMYFTRYEIDPLKDLKKADIKKFFEKFAQEDEARKAGQEDYVKMKDFQRQDDKLVEIENSLVQLVQRVHELLRTMENLEGVKRRPLQL